MTPAKTDALTVRAVRVELEIAIAAPIARVWEAITTETDSWWHNDFYATANPKGIVFEARPGGRMYEDAGNNAGLLWFTVTAIDPPHSLHLAGHVAPPFGGPSTSLLWLSLESKGEAKTVLKVTDAAFGVVSESYLESGWRLLFEDGLKRYLESD